MRNRLLVPLASKHSSGRNVLRINSLLTPTARDREEEANRHRVSRERCRTVKGVSGRGSVLNPISGRVEAVAGAGVVPEVGVVPGAVVGEGGSQNYDIIVIKNYWRQFFKEN